MTWAHFILSSTSLSMSPVILLILLRVPVYDRGNNSPLWLMFWLGDVSQGSKEAIYSSEIDTSGGPGFVLPSPHLY